MPVFIAVFLNYFERGQQKVFSMLESKYMKNVSKIIFYLVSIVIVLSIGFVLSKENKKTEEMVACTQDAMQCPDGSYVGRMAPSCEFAACTEKPVATSSEAASPLKTFFDAEKKVGFEYLDNFYIGNTLNKYVLPVQWPPELNIVKGVYSCKRGGSAILPEGKTEAKIINGKNYCITTQIEGAAGSVYTTYVYKSVVEKKVVTLTFIVRVPECSNYDEVEKLVCEEEKKIFELDKKIDNIFQSIQFQNEN